MTDDEMRDLAWGVRDAGATVLPFEDGDGAVVFGGLVFVGGDGVSFNVRRYRAWTDEEEGGVSQAELVLVSVGGSPEAVLVSPVVSAVLAVVRRGQRPL